MSGLELKVPPPIVSLTFAVGMWFVSEQLPTFSFFMPGLHFLTFAFMGAGIIMGLCGMIEFRKVQTTLNPINPYASSALVTKGVYRLSRNPMYAGLLLILLGWAINLSNILSFFFLPLFIVYMNRFQIMPEERVLSGKFGTQFTAYRRSVRRWF